MAMFEQQQQKTRKPKKSLKEIIKEQFENSAEMANPNTPKNVLCIGKDATGKTGSVLSSLLDDIKDDEKIAVIDIDNSAIGIIKEFHLSKYQSGNILYLNPFCTIEERDGNTSINYKGTIDNIRTAAQVIQDYMDEGVKIKAVVLDGISSLLEFCEYYMREEKNLDVDAGVQMNFWKVRNRVFREATTVYLKMPVDAYFIAHDDFIKTNDDGTLSSVKQRLHDECSHRLQYYKDFQPSNQNIVEFTCIMTKDRTDITNVEREIIFATTNRKLQKSNWKGSSINDLFTRNKEENS